MTKNPLRVKVNSTPKSFILPEKEDFGHTEVDHEDDIVQDDDVHREEQFTMKPLFNSNDPSSFGNGPFKSNINVVSSSDIPHINELTYANADKLESALNKLNSPENISLNSIMKEETQELFEYALSEPYKSTWRTLDIKSIAKLIKLTYPPWKGSVQTDVDKIIDLQSVFNSINPERESSIQAITKKMITLIHNIKAENQSVTSFDQRPLIKALVANLYDRERPNPAAKRIHQILHTRIDQFTDLREVSEAFHQCATDIRSKIDEVKGYGYKISKPDDTKDSGHKRTLLDANKPSNNPKPLITQKNCTLCGRKHSAECLLATHPDRNTTTSAWAISPQGKAWAAKGHEVLPARITLAGTPFKGPDLPVRQKQAISNKKPRKNLINSTNEIRFDSTHGFLIPCILQVDDRYFVASALLDTGARDGNYINKKIANKIKQEAKNHNFFNNHHLVCTALNGCSPVSESIFINVMFPLNVTTQITHFNHRYNNSELNSKNLKDFVHNTQTVLANCTVIDSQYEVIIGRPTIIQFNLLDTLRYHFVQFNDNACACTNQSIDHNSTTSLCSCRKALANPQDPNGQLLSSAVTDSVLAGLYTQSQTQSNGYQREHMSNYIDYQPEDDEFCSPLTDDDPFAPPEHTNHNTNYIPTQLYGSESLKQKLKELCTEFLDLFHTTLSSEPARVTPFEIQCDRAKWMADKRNKLPPRLQTSAKQTETKKQIDYMLDKGIVRHSNATSYSQVLLVKKPNGSWRFTVDYRSLNECCTFSPWPIPNINLLFDRIGKIRPKPSIFGKIDFTSGYHQAGLAENARILTAFITVFGMFEWCRVPMGPIGSASYFQMQIASLVLTGLVYIICEVYLDDVLIHGTDDDNFLHNVRRIFDRFRKHRITINPDKCILGKDSIEFLGRTISCNGIEHNRSRIDAVLQFPEPKFQKQLKSFLGIVNYFHAHIQNHSILAQPLHVLLTPYQPTHVITWTGNTRKAFQDLKARLHNCPKLSFLDPEAPIYLDTDASDYGIGGHLHQTIIDPIHSKHNDVPVAFISKALNKRQVKWSTPEKECYAIYYSLQKLDYLLRDVRFCIRTDHQNLTYLHESANAKVYRWKVFIQHFNFDIEYIKGSDNRIADGFSRLITPLSDTFQSLPNEAQLNVLNAIHTDQITYKALKAVHSHIAGHSGVERTLRKLTEYCKRQHIPMPSYAREHIKEFIKKCPACQKMNYLRIPIHTHPYTTAAYEPMRVINVDSIGPFSVDDNNNTYILVIIDCFTRWIELYAIPDLSGVTAAKALLNHIGRFGCPSILRSDNGTQFVNETVDELHRLIGTEHATILAYSKEENAIVERANKEVNRHLRAMLYDLNVFHAWSTCLPFIQRIINSSVHAITNCKPVDLLFGNAIDLDKGIFLPLSLPDASLEIKLTEWIQKMLKAQAAVIHAAQNNQNQHDEQHLQRATSQRTVFPDNSYVLVEYPSTGLHKGPPNKAQTFRRGPLKVVTHQANHYTLENLVTGKLERVHLTALRPFYYDPAVTDPIDVANRDQFVTVVDQIIGHQPDLPLKELINSKSKMTFTVRWKDLPPSCDRELPWKELRNNPALHTYLAEKRLKSLIPREFRSI